MDNEIEIDIAKFQRAAELALSNTAYRQKHECADFIVLNRFQKALLESVSHNRFVLGRCGGQVGKSTAAMLFLNTCIRLGRNPYRPTPNLARTHKFVAWILSESGQTTILGPQSRLLGNYPTEPGTGLLALRNIKRCIPAHGVTGLVQDVLCESDAGEPCIIRFKQFLQGKAALTSEAVDLIILDELPSDMALFAELMQRVSATNGTILLVCTPGRQQNDILHWFREPGKSKAIVTGSVDDADHMTAQQKADLAAHYRSISEAEYRSRFLGEEFVAGGSALSFNPEDVYHRHEIADFGPSTRWLLGCDLGHGTGQGGHPTAFILCAYHKDIDRLYVCREFRKNQVLPSDVASTLRHWPKSGAPCAWGAAEGATSGYSKKSYRDLYADEGFRMLPEHATHDAKAGGGVDLETSVTTIQQKLRNGELLIHPDCQNLIHELLDLERDMDGDLIPVRDDLFSALRYAVMMRSRAKTDAEIFSGVTNPFDHLYRHQQRGDKAQLDPDAGERYFGIDA